MVSELKPCPFCGANFKMSQEPHDNHPVNGMWYVYHDYGPIGSPARSCRLDITGHFETEAEAVAACNTRPTPTPAPDGDGLVDYAIAELAGSDFECIRTHGATLATAITTLTAQAQADAAEIERLRYALGKIILAPSEAHEVAIAALGEQP